MRLLFLGDVVGRSGRDAVFKYLPELRKKLNINFVIINGENSANGYGLSEKIVNQYLENKADVITCGDHCFDQKETKFFINQYPQMLRPANMPMSLPGKGYNIYELSHGKKILVIHLLCQLFIRFQVNCPFETVTNILKEYQLGKNIDYIFVDIHGEATSEKMAMGHFLDGKISAICGSHTHIPTADTQILSKGTAFQSDAGMCGDYDSVIGFNKEISVPGFISKVRFEKNETAEGEGTVCGFVVDLDEKTGLAKKADYLRIGGKLKEHIPTF